MRKLLALTAALALLAGCGDDDDGGGAELAGRLHGEAFAPAEIVFAGPEGSTTCTFTGLPTPYGIGAALVAFSTRAGACALADPCRRQRELTYVAGVVAHARIFPPPAEAPPLDAGTYAVYGDLAAAAADFATASGEPIRASLLSAERTDAQCIPAPPGAPPPATGTLRIESVTEAELRGEIDVTFQDGQGGFLRGPFTAARCAGVTFDPCFTEAGLECSGAPTCE